MLGIKKCLLSRQKLESNHSGAEGNLISLLNNARFLYKKSDIPFLVGADIRKGIVIVEDSID